jgi:hypothetical protein
VASQLAELIQCQESEALFHGLADQPARQRENNFDKRWRINDINPPDA